MNELNNWKDPWKVMASDTNIWINMEDKVCDLCINKKYHNNWFITILSDEMHNIGYSMVNSF